MTQSKYFDVDVDFMKNNESVLVLDYNNCDIVRGAAIESLLDQLIANVVRVVTFTATNENVNHPNQLPVESCYQTDERSPFPVAKCNRAGGTVGDATIEVSVRAIH